MSSYSGKEAFLAMFRDNLQISEKTVSIHQSPSKYLVNGRYLLPRVPKDDGRDAFL